MTDDAMLVDYKKRCVVKVSMGDIEYDSIYYGITALEYQPIFEDGRARDLPAPYAELSSGGRRPGHATEKPRHYFNKRIQTDEERQEGQARTSRTLVCGVIVQGGGGADDVGAPDAGVGVAGAAQVAFPRAVAGSGDRGPHQDEDEFHNPEVTT